MNFKTAGESHGKGLVGIISDFPSGVAIDHIIIDNELKRRQKGYGRGGRMAIEKDRIELISGVRKGSVYITASKEMLTHLVKLVSGLEQVGMEEIRDMAGELANTIAGNAQNECGSNFSFLRPNK